MLAVSLAVPEAMPTVTAVAFRASGEPDPLAVSYTRDVRPILSNRCFKCHGPDEAAREAGLRLDTFEGATGALRHGGRAIVPGEPGAGELLRRVTSDDAEERMPPPEAGAPLTAREVETLRRWVEEGARYEAHWSLVAPRRAEPPRVGDEGWVRNEIDRFVLARLEREGLRPSAEADRSTLIRRVSLDLTGLPPTPEEVEAFVGDARPDAWERVVDRLLASPAYGERMAGAWLDQARYADTKGYEADRRRTMWPWRDWVIRAFNADLPYDRFIAEQLAGDLLPDAGRDALVATAFHRNTMTNDEGGTDDEEFRVAAVVDRVNTTMQVFMGLTMACAQCHTHKYDPITHTDYYRVFAVFNTTLDADRMDEAPTLPIPVPERGADLARALATVEHAERLPERVAEILARVEGGRAPVRDSAHSARPWSPFDEWTDLFAFLDEGIARARADLAAVEATLPQLPVMREQAAEERRTTRRMERGSFLSPAEVVEAGAPSAFHAWPEGAPVDRLGFARWLTDGGNPLTARVAVNRAWEQLFGAGLVETSEDFGVQGSLPSHPELLDWLATEFVRDGWSVKRLVRTMVLSATYRQSSAVTAEGLERDPGNRLLGRGPRFRLDAETIRDQSLAVSGLLSRKMYGPSVFPPQPEGVWSIVYNADRWETSVGEDRYRRALYTFWRRTSPHPAMTTFDAPSREFCLPRRIRTNTPLQALVTLNDPALVEAAQALARRVMTEGGADPAARAGYAVRVCLARRATEAEVGRLVALYESELAHYRARPTDAGALATDPLGPLPEGMGAAEAAAWTTVANVLLNLDEFLTRT
ncbi:MAG TPA: PSD1 and planctomycete cytochrome C domain-containing protein [Phycisphaerales bacterium]|nr:PSD1 and planctomycete cytochrome C domain-containing protein [Phycisphaerales bacterium]